MNPAATGTARLTATTVLLGSLIVILSQFVTGYTLVDQTDSLIANVTLIDKHGVTITIVGLIAALSLVVAVTTGSRAAVFPVLGAGIAVILVFLLVDLPDIGATGFFDTPGAGNLDATGQASTGLWMELVGGVVLVFGGIALATLNESQLRAISPREPRNTNR